MDGHFLEGVVDEVRIYNRALTPEEIQALYLRHVDRVVNVGSSQNIQVDAYYEYDKTAFSGTVNLNDTASKSTVGKYGFKVSSISDNNYGLTTFTTGETTIIWDRVKVSSLTASDTRTNVDSSVNIDATLIYEYDSAAVTDGSVSIEGVSATHQGSGVWRITQSKSTVQSITYDSISCSGNTYGITVVNMNGKSVTVIWDRIEIYYEVIDDSRVNIGDSIEFRVKARLDYDNHPLGSGDSLTANTGSMTWDGANGWFEVSRTENTVTSYTFTVTAGNEATYGITAIYVAVSNPTGIWDRVKIVSGGFTDNRVDIGSSTTVYFEVRYEYDNALVTDGSVYINETAATYVPANSRWELSVSKSSVGEWAYGVSSVSGNTYGITVINNVAGYKNCIWDRLEIYEISASDTRINVGASFELRYKIRYDYDDVIFDDSKGTVSGFTWDDTNGYWKKTVTGSSSVTSTNYDENYISITDSTYGLTVKTDVAGVNVITDKVRIYFEQINDARVNVGDDIEFRVKALLLYDNHPLGSGDTITANFGTLTWDSSNNWFDGTYSKSTVSDYTFTISSVSEATYGITVFEINVTNPTGVWDNGTGLS